MATEHDDVNDESLLQRDLLLSTLASWRYFLLLTFPPLLWATLIAQPGLMRVIVALLCAVSLVGCWRIWLDACYFRLITPANNAQAGAVLSEIWRREKLRELKLRARQQGALTLLRRTMFVNSVLWVLWLFALVFSD